MPSTHAGVGGVDRVMKSIPVGVSGVNRQTKTAYAGVSGVNRVVFEKQIVSNINLSANGRLSVAGRASIYSGTENGCLDFNGYPAYSKMHWATARFTFPYRLTFGNINVTYKSTVYTEICGIIEYRHTTISGSGSGGNPKYLTKTTKSSSGRFRIEAQGTKDTIRQIYVALYSQNGPSTETWVEITVDNSSYQEEDTQRLCVIAHEIILYPCEYPNGIRANLTTMTPDRLSSSTSTGIQNNGTVVWDVL